MTFAQWEKQIRMFDEFVMIYTELDANGAVVRAWTSDSEWVAP